MKNASQYVKPLATFLKHLKKNQAPFPEQDPVTRVVFGFLQWNAGRRLADQAHARLMALLVDNNDLRVSHPKEVVTLLGDRYPLGQERALRLHDVLQAIFEREHSVTLAPLAEKSRKDQRHYLDSLPGMVPYVADQVFLLNFGGHAIPVDDVIAALLKMEEVVDPDADVAAIAGFLMKNTDAEDAAQIHADLRAWADANVSKVKSVLVSAEPEMPLPPVALPPAAAQTPAKSAPKKKK